MLKCVCVDLLRLDFPLHWRSHYNYYNFNLVGFQLGHRLVLALAAPINIYLATVAWLSCNVCRPLLFQQALSLSIQPFLKEKFVLFCSNHRARNNNIIPPYSPLLSRLSRAVSHHSGSPRHRRYNKGAARWKSSIRYIKVAVGPRVGRKTPY